MRKHTMPQRSPEWLQLKKSKISGTELSKLMSNRASTREDAKYEFIANRLTVGVEDPDSYENPMDRGLRLEPEAIAAFEFQTGLVTEVLGFCEDDAEPAIGQSPDRYIANTNDTKAVEVKCLEGKKHVKIWLTNEVPDEYHWQLVQYFVVNDKLARLYFLSFNPSIPTHSLHVIEIKREDLAGDIENAREVQLAFLKEVKQEIRKIIKL